MVHCNVIILVIVCGACMISDVQSMKCSINGKLRRVRRFFQKDRSNVDENKPQQSNVPQNNVPSNNVPQNNVPKRIPKNVKRFNDECQKLVVAPHPPPTGFNIDQPATLGSPRGHTSEVVRVNYGEENTPYAVKRIRLSWILNEKKTNAFADVCTEMKILQEVEHPFIVKMHWSLWTEKYAVMIFDYYEMGTLFDLIVSTGPLSEEKAKFYSAQLLLVVEYLHEKNIVHRDIKDDNVLVDNEGYLKVTDFGTSEVDDGQLIGDLVGTPTYAAPEIFIANRLGSTTTYLRKPTDIYSFGISIFVMLFRTFPYSCGDIDSMLNLMDQKAISLPEHVYTKVEKNGQGKFEAKYYTSTEKLTIGEMLLGMLKRDPKGRLTIKQIKDHESWNTPSAWIKPGSNPPKFDWEALQQRKLRVPIQPNNDFQKYIDTESGYEFDKIETSYNQA